MTVASREISDREGRQGNFRNWAIPVIGENNHDNFGVSWMGEEIFFHGAQHANRYAASRMGFDPPQARTLDLRPEISLRRYVCVHLTTVC